MALYVQKMSKTELKLLYGSESLEKRKSNNDISFMGQACTYTFSLFSISGVSCMCSLYRMV